MSAKLASRKSGIIPGFGLSLGYTLFYLSLIVLIPLATIFITSAGMGWPRFLQVVTGRRVLSAYWLSLYTAFVAAGLNGIVGILVAWVLVRYKFPGRRFLDAIVDLPFALPTAVAGISLSALFGPNGWIGHFLEGIGIHVVNNPMGIIIALTFIGFPFIVRTVQPVLQELEVEIEEAGLSLGAGKWRVFRSLIFPQLFPALLTGFTLAFARGIGEYGSIVFISGNLPFKTEIVPLLIVQKLDQFDYAGASAIALVMLLISFALLLILNALQWWRARRLTGA